MSKSYIARVLKHNAEALIANSNRNERFRNDFADELALAQKIIESPDEQSYSHVELKKFFDAYDQARRPTMVTAMDTRSSGVTVDLYHSSRGGFMNEEWYRK